MENKYLVKMFQFMGLQNLENGHVATHPNNSH